MVVQRLAGSPPPPRKKDEDCRRLAFDPFRDCRGTPASQALASKARGVLAMAPSPCAKRSERRRGSHTLEGFGCCWAPNASHRSTGRPSPSGGGRRRLAFDHFRVCRSTPASQVLASKARDALATHGAHAPSHANEGSKRLRGFHPLEGLGCCCAPNASQQSTGRPSPPKEGVAAGVSRLTTSAFVGALLRPKR